MTLDMINGQRSGVICHAYHCVVAMREFLYDQFNNPHLYIWTFVAVGYVLIFGIYWDAADTRILHVRIELLRGFRFSKL